MGSYTAITRRWLDRRFRLTKNDVYFRIDRGHMDWPAGIAQEERLALVTRHFAPKLIKQSWALGRGSRCCPSANANTPCSRRSGRAN
jgi:hypothetical protein